MRAYKWGCCAYLVARLDACSVSRPALNRRKDDQLSAGWVCSNEQPHTLHLPIGAHPEVCILPVHGEMRQSEVALATQIRSPHRAACTVLWQANIWILWTPVITKLPVVCMRFFF